MTPLSAARPDDFEAVEFDAVVWDFGGVFTGSPFEAFNAYEAAHGLPRDFIRRVNATNPHDNAWARFERAQIDRAGFDALFLAESTALGWPTPGADVLPLLSGAVRPAMVAALKACKARYKVGCITNNMAQVNDNSGHGPGMADSPEGAQGPRGTSGTAPIMALFDVVIESSKAGVRKPDPAIYRLMCEALDVSAEKCLYLDDLGINCKGAAVVGMTAIKVVSEAQALADLSAATGLIFETSEATS
ncbi:MAG TPA: HAD-IA family hydrolase [Caulobacteraceae bacterium]|nr:HAD-IA family hydrolase [Caulobacteraceae bacterium]